MKDPILVADVQRFVPDLDVVAEQLRADPQAALAHAVERPGRPRDANLGRRGSEPAPEGEIAPEIPPEFRDPARLALERTIAGALSAIEKVRRDGTDASLTPDERVGLEAVIIVAGRPAILVQDGTFFDPPQPWGKLEAKRAEIDLTLARVGRIEVTGHPRFEWVGTGFLVGENIVLTNRHVVKHFGLPTGSGWVFEDDMTAHIDFAEELGSVTRREFPITEIVGVHDDVDLALLRVDGPGLSPLPVDGDPSLVTPEREVYVVGYPTADSLNDPEVMRAIFSNIYGVKRLQPGALMGGLEGKLFRHDCSTLGGNSGSCVVDLQSGRVIGLHFKGTYRVANVAVALGAVATDPLVKANVAFV